MKVKTKCVEYRYPVRTKGGTLYLVDTWSVPTKMFYFQFVCFVQAGNEITTGNGNKLQNAPQLCLGCSLTSAIIVSPNIMYMRDFVLWIARRRSTCLKCPNRSTNQHLNWLVYNVGSYGIIVHSLSDCACVAWFYCRIGYSNSRSGWVTA